MGNETGTGTGRRAARYIIDGENPEEWREESEEIFEKILARRDPW